MNYLVRKLTVFEYSKYANHLKKLDDQSRYLRFGFKAKDQTIDTMVNDIVKNPQKHVLFGVENSNLELIGVGHIALGQPVELAFSVLQEFQGQGMGSSIIKRCIQYCRSQSITKGYMVCLSSNYIVRHLCVKHGLKLSLQEGEVLASFELNPPTLITLTNESLDNNLAVADFFKKRSLKFWSDLS